MAGCLTLTQAIGVQVPIPQQRKVRMPLVSEEVDGAMRVMLKVMEGEYGPNFAGGRVTPICKYCKMFFVKMSRPCTKVVANGECDCPKCLGICGCKP
jgi:hypothetical protein